MPTSNKKRDLKTRIGDYTSKFYVVEQKFKKLKLNFAADDDSMKKKKGSSDGITLDGFSSSSDDDDDDRLLNKSCDMEFESASQKSSIGDKAMQVEGGLKKSKNLMKLLSKSEREIEK